MAYTWTLIDLGVPVYETGACPKPPAKVDTLPATYVPIFHPNLFIIHCCASLAWSFIILVGPARVVAGDVYAPFVFVPADRCSSVSHLTGRRGLPSTQLPTPATNISTTRPYIWRWFFLHPYKMALPRSKTCSPHSPFPIRTWNLPSHCWRAPLDYPRPRPSSPAFWTHCRPRVTDGRAICRFFPLASAPETPVAAAPGAAAGNAAASCVQTPGRGREAFGEGGSKGPYPP